MPGINTSADCSDLRAAWQSSHLTVTCLACVNFASPYQTPDTRTGAICHVSVAVRGAVTLWHVVHALPVKRPSVMTRDCSRAHASASCCCCCDNGGDPGRRRSCTIAGDFAS